MNKRGFEWGILGKALLFLFILTVAFIIISGLAGGSSGKLGSLSNLIPGIPEKAPVLEVGQKLENAPCRFSYECSTGFMCWKGDRGGEGLGSCQACTGIGIPGELDAGRAGAWGNQENALKNRMMLKTGGYRHG